MDKQVLGVGPPLVFLAYEILHRHLDVGKKHLVEMVQTGDRDDRTHFDPGCPHVDEQEGNPFLPLGGLFGAHQAENPVSLMRIGRPTELVLFSCTVFRPLTT